MAELHPKQRFRIYIHGNNDFKSSQLLEKLQLSQENSLETVDTIMELFPFSDLNIFDKYSPVKPDENLKLSEGSKLILGEVTAILVLISQTEIFSDDIEKLIVNLPYNPCYGLNETNEMEWWNRVIVVFSFGEYEGSDEKVQKSISKSRGIRDIVGKAGGRYVWITDIITQEELTKSLHNKMTEQLRKFNYEEMLFAFHEMIEKLENRTGKKEDFECEFEQTFIMFGSNKSGNTAQENLSLKPYESPPFKLHLINKRFRLSKTLQCDDKADVNANIVHEQTSNEVFKTQIIDMPAFDDPEVSPKVYGEYLARCVTEARKTKRVTTFLILIEVNSNLPRFFERIHGIAKFLSIWILNEDIKSLTTQNENNFFSNAKILFTGTDELQIFDQKLQQILKEDRYSNLKGLLNLVQNQKYSLRNVDNSREPKKWILRNCLKRELPFKTDRIQVNDDPNIDTKAIKEKLENYITIFLSQLNGILKGKPVIILLIDPECVKYENISEFISQLPNTPDIQDVMDGIANKDPWEYTYIVFKQKMEPHIEDNYVLKELKEKVKTRYIILTENTPDELDQKLNTLLSAALAAGENDPQNEANYLVVDNLNEEKGGKGIISEDNLRIKPVKIQLYEEKTDSPVKVSTNRFIWEDPDIPPFVFFTQIQL